MEYLDCINYILAQVGAAPVPDLNGNLPDVQTSQLRYNEASRTLQKRGWYFNTDWSAAVEPDDQDNGRIAVPATAINVRLQDGHYVSIRDGFLYNNYTQSTDFTEFGAFTVDWINELPWEQLPTHAQDIIRFRAAAAHILIELEDLNKHQTELQFATAELRELKKEELRQMKHNLVANPAVQRMLGRVQPYGRRSRIRRW